MEQPGQYCCDDGTCIHSELVCNNFANCQDRSDERNCTTIDMPEYGYNKNLPSIGFKNDKKRLLRINSTFTFLNIFDIDEGESSFDLYFMIHFEWFDDDLQFRFLKDDDNDNTLSLELVKQIWTPDVEFDVIEKVIKESKPRYYVTKKGAPKLEGHIEVKEVYEGSENPINLWMKNRIRNVGNKKSYLHLHDSGGFKILFGLKVYFLICCPLQVYLSF